MKATGIAASMILFLCLALMLGPVIHSVVPHTHGAGGEETPLWQSIHSALHSEKKKVFFAAADAVPLFAFVVLMFFALSPAFVHGRRLLRARHSLHELLCSGKLRYRMFG